MGCLLQCPFGSGLRKLDWYAQTLIVLRFLVAAMPLFPHKNENSLLQRLSFLHLLIFQETHNEMRPHHLTHGKQYSFSFLTRFVFQLFFAWPHKLYFSFWH